MVIAPEILIPSAIAAVAVLLVLVRLISGVKKAVITQENARSFLELEAPDLPNYFIVLNEDHSAALIKSALSEPIGLIRSFGNKLVFQPLGPDDISKNTENDDIIIKRAGLGLPPLLFTPENTERGFI